jgi:hypothetical protein
MPVNLDLDDLRDQLRLLVALFEVLSISLKNPEMRPDLDAIDEYVVLMWRLTQDIRRRVDRLA